MAKGKKCWLAGLFAVSLLLGGCAPGKDLYEAAPSYYDEYVPLQMQAEQLLEFPYVIRTASVVVLQMASYEGPAFDENTYVQDVAAILVSNPMNRTLKYAEIVMHQGDRTLIFEIEHLPAGSRILVPECSGQRFSDAPVVACECTRLMEMETAESISVTAEDGALTVTNNGENPCTATLFYKSYYPENDFLLGGKSRSVTVSDLQAGESRRVELRDFSKERTRLVMIMTE